MKQLQQLDVKECMYIDFERACHWFLYWQKVDSRLSCQVWVHCTQSTHNEFAECTSGA